jgi:hypothetical protein
MDQQKNEQVQAKSDNLKPEISPEAQQQQKEAGVPPAEPTGTLQDLDPNELMAKRNQVSPCAAGCSCNMLKVSMRCADSMPSRWARLAKAVANGPSWTVHSKLTLPFPCCAALRCTFSCLQILWEQAQRGEQPGLMLMQDALSGEKKAQTWGNEPTIIEPDNQN